MKYIIFPELLLRKKNKIKPDPKQYSALVGKGSVVPCQIEAYFLALNKYLPEKSTVLDVGFGLGYGLNILAIKANKVFGVDVDKSVLEYCNNTVVGRNPRLVEITTYNGYELKYTNSQFDVVTCIDVLEHVEDYNRFIIELMRVAKIGVFISTPNRRPEYTNADGSPKNHWHLREWNFNELDKILKVHGEVEWHFLNGSYEGPFSISDSVKDDSLTLSPFLRKEM